MSAVVLAYIQRKPRQHQLPQRGQLIDMGEQRHFFNLKCRLDFILSQLRSGWLQPGDALELLAEVKAQIPYQPAQPPASRQHEGTAP